MGTIGFIMPTKDFIATADIASTTDNCNRIHCPFCGASNYSGFKFCWQCGEPIL